MTEDTSALRHARQALAAGQIAVAAQAVRAHLACHPDDVPAIHLLATTAIRAGALPQAEALLRRAAALAPADSDIALALAGLLARGELGEEALALADAVLARAPLQRAALSLRAILLVQADRLQEADETFRRLTRHHQGDAAAWLNHGHLLKALGRIDASVDAYRRAIACAPGDGTAWWNIANLDATRFDDADLAAMQATLAASRDDGARTLLHFALGKAIDARADHAGAFEHWRTGNALRRARVPYDPALTTAGFRRAEALLTPALLAGRAGGGDPDPAPIFIVGLPRSGSTLVEQILASHPAVEGLGELHDLHRIARPLAGADSHLDGLPALSPAALRELGRAYLASVARSRGTDRPNFTDKMPSNWIYAGLIARILPNARIVDVRRHPMACGFANFTQLYARGNDFAYDLPAIGGFIVDYTQHMAHVDEVAPGLVHRLHYEALVADPQGEIHRLLAYLKLPYDPACLRPHETRRAVHTASAAQVRRPIGPQGLGRWRNYAPWLGELERALGPVLTRYPDVAAG